MIKNKQKKRRGALTPQPYRTYLTRYIISECCLCFVCNSMCNVFKGVYVASVSTFSMLFLLSFRSVGSPPRYIYYICVGFFIHVNFSVFRHV